MPFPFVAVLVSAAVSAGLTLLGGLLAPKPKAAKEDEIEVPTATEDRIKPYFVGTVRHLSPNAIWYGDFSTKKIKQGGLGFLAGNPTIGFKYFIGIQLDLGWGKVDALRRIELGGEEAWTGNIASGNFTIDKKELFQSDPVKNGFQATGVFYPGDGVQAVDPYVAGKVGGFVPAYRDDALIVFKGLTSGGAYIGNSPTFPEIKIDVSRYPNTLGVTGGKHIVNTFDANPVCALHEFMTRENNEFGGGFIDAQFDLNNWRAAADAVFAEGIGCSLLITTEREVDNVIESYLKLIDAVINVNMNTGLLELKLIRFDYDPDTIPHFTDDDFTEVNYTRGSWQETLNEVRLSYSDRTAEHTDRIAAAQDSASASGNGEVITSDIDIEGIATPSLANTIVWRELKSLSIPLGRMTGKMNREGYELSGGMVFKWSSVKFGVNAMIFRVSEASDGDFIEVKCVQDVFSLGSTAFNVPDAPGWQPPTLDAVNISLAAIFEQPYFFHQTSDNRIFTVASPANGSQQSYDLRTKLTTETNYVERLTSVGYTPNGTLNAQFISDSGSLVIVPGAGMEDIPNAVTPEEIATGRGLIQIDSEILAYESFTVDGSGNFVFSNVWGGLLDTLKATHAAGARAWFIAEEIAADPTNYPAGASVNAKLLSNAPNGQIAEGSAIIVTL